jgi:hypothetical protein
MTSTPIMDIAMRGQHRQRPAPGTVSSPYLPPRGQADAAEIAAHVATLTSTDLWTPEKDLQLVTLLRSGMGLDRTAAAIPGVSRSQALRRWNRLMLDTSFETQTRTHAELARRASEVTDDA